MNRKLLKDTYNIGKNMAVYSGRTLLVLMNLRLWGVFLLITQNIPSVWLSFAPINFRQLLEC